MILEERFDEFTQELFQGVLRELAGDEELLQESNPYHDLEDEDEEEPETESED